MNLKNLILSASLAFGAAGCAGPKMAPMPRLGTPVQRGSEFVEYIRKLDVRCDTRKISPLHDKEHLFYKYVSWLSEISDTPFDNDNFDIVDDRPVFGVLDGGIAYWVMPSGIYLFGDVNVRNKDSNLAIIAHEFGHHTDRNLNALKYIVSNDERVIAESTADSFQHYAGLELVKLGNKQIGLSYLLSSVNLDKKDELEALIEGKNVYRTGRAVAFVLMNDFEEMGKVWQYLATNSRSTVLTRVRTIIAKKGSLYDSVRLGANLTTQEKNNTLHIH